MKTFVRWPRSVAVVVGALAVSSSAPALAMTTSPSTAVDPAALATGPTPQIAWVRGATLVQPQTSRETALGGGTNPLRLVHVKGGYVAETVRDGDRMRLVFVSYQGKRRVLAKRSALGADVASTDGRWLVLSSDTYATGQTRRQSLRVIRVSDGRTVASRTFPARSTVMAAGQGKVLVQEARQTVSWDIAHRRVSVLARTSHAALPTPTSIAPAASFGAKTFVVRKGAKDQIRRLRDHQRLWSTSKGEYVLSYSPDDRLVVTAAQLAGFSEDAPWDQATELRVRSARTGRIQRVFTGRFGYGRDEQPVWEDATTLLLHVSGAWQPVGDEGDGRYLDNGIARCTVSGACDSVARQEPGDIPVVLMQHKSN